MSTEELKRIVRESGVPRAEVIDARGQWVKILGDQAPEAARRFQGGPDMLAYRLVADYAITKGKCLLICGGDGTLPQTVGRGLVSLTDLEVTALYASEQAAKNAQKRIAEGKLADRIRCRVGTIGALPFDAASYDLVVGIGPFLIREKDKTRVMCEIHRILRPGGAALVGGRYLGMPAAFRVSTEALRDAAAETKLPTIRVYDDMGQWVEIRKGVEDKPRGD